MALSTNGGQIAFTMLFLFLVDFLLCSFVSDVAAQVTNGLKLGVISFSCLTLGSMGFEEYPLP